MKPPSIVSSITPPIEVEGFPKLLVFDDPRAIVIIAHSKDEGTVVHPGRSGFIVGYRIGYDRLGGSWKPFQGKVTLSPNPQPTLTQS